MLSKSQWWVSFPSHISEFSVLNYRAIARKRGRDLAVRVEADLDFSNYSATASIDRLDLEVELGRKTQFQHVRSAIFALTGREVFVQPLEAGAGRVSSKFVLRIWSPDFEILPFILAFLDRRYGCAPDPEVVGLSLALDFQPRKGGVFAIMQMTALLRTHLLPTAHYLQHQLSRPRCVRGGKVRLAIGDTNEAFGGGWGLDRANYLTDSIFYLGSRDSGPHWGVLYREDEVSEHGGWSPLPLEYQSARALMVLKRGDLRELGINNVLDMLGFSFRSLHGSHFSFRTPRFIWRQCAASSAVLNYRNVTARCASCGSAWPVWRCSTLPGRTTRIAWLRTLEGTACLASRAVRGRASSSTVIRPIPSSRTSPTEHCVCLIEGTRRSIPVLSPGSRWPRSGNRSGLEQ